MLANAAIAFRDLLIVVAFVPQLTVDVATPLIALVIAGIALSYGMSDWKADFDTEFDSPFDLETALKFGALFLLVFVSR